MTKNRTVAIKATLAWPFFNKKSDFSGKYEVTLCDLTVAQAKKLVAIGIPKARIRKEDPKKLAEREAAGAVTFDKGARYLTVKSGEQYFKVRDGQTKQELSEDVFVGNGSVATVLVEAVPYQNFGGGVMAGFKEVLIHELIEYEAPDADEDGDDTDEDDDEDWGEEA